MKGAKAQGLSVQGVMETAKEKGLREFNDNQKGAISAVGLTGCLKPLSGFKPPQFVHKGILWKSLSSCCPLWGPLMMLYLAQIFVCDPAFVRVRKGVYAIRALMGDAPFEAIGKPSKKNKPAKGRDVAEAGAKGDADPPPTSLSASQEEVESLTKVCVLSANLHIFCALRNNFLFVVGSADWICRFGDRWVCRRTNRWREK